MVDLSFVWTVSLVHADLLPQVRPLYELVKEVECAGLKKLHMRRALEEYLAAEHPCRCRPCHNNGQPLLQASQCVCACRLGTSGAACQSGAVVGEQPGKTRLPVSSVSFNRYRPGVITLLTLPWFPSGVIHGSWSCWSSWGSCAGGQRRRMRACTNPAPSRGGLHCVGPQVEQKQCDDADVQHLQ